MSRNAFFGKIGCSNLKAQRILDEFCKLVVLEELSHSTYSFYRLNKSGLNARSYAEIYWREKLSELITFIFENYDCQGIYFLRIINDL